MRCRKVDDTGGMPKVDAYEPRSLDERRFLSNPPPLRPSSHY